MATKSNVIIVMATFLAILLSMATLFILPTSPVILIIGISATFLILIIGFGTASIIDAIERK